MQLPRAEPGFEGLFPASIAERAGRASDFETEVTAWFDKLRTPLLRYLSSFGLTIQDAEEVIQEVFLCLFLHLRAGKSRSNLRGWIFRVAHNLGLKCRERNQRALKIMPPCDPQLIEIHLDGSPDPEQQTSSLQHSERLLKIVSALPEQDRRALYLRAEGLRYREIAQILGISLGGVALSLARVLGRLRKVDCH